MSELEIDTHGLDALVSRMQGAPQKLAQRIMAAMKASVALFEEAVAVNTPVGATGNLRSGIYGEVYGQPLNSELVGKVGTAAVYGYHVEFGRKPGTWPEIDSLRYWVVRKLGVPDELADGVTFQIARQIRFRGTRPKHMFKKGFDARRAAVAALWERALGDLAKEVF